MMTRTTYQEFSPMHETVTTVTRKGRITLPAGIRKALGISRGDKVVLSLEDDAVRLKRTESVTAQTAGSLHTEQPALPADEERQAAEEAIAQESVQCMERR
jgi:AbrB family looped-hinge helix DNA binding protein